MIRTVPLHVHTPELDFVVERVARLRFEGWDGHRGVLPGHEPGLARVCEGPIHLVTYDAQDREHERHLATEEGLLEIRPAALHLVTPWAALAPTLAALLTLVERRGSFRRRAAEEARALIHRHEVALHQALMRLRKDPAA